ncbi:hypothetical protein J7400_17010 [Shimia sp. R9_2]|uniref:hypothetical protein n=1 Tax=Shimia sp. R9_2 TaxID=2821112 RepID=UPI001AD99CE8|nr:hypothetical protein [Shimia sp. R9_2]MBO9398374.1 hypothetical protein [Shimia sp. R9_2]
MILDIWNSFQRLPLWVRIWMCVVLAPINMVPLFFLGTHPSAIWIALLSVMGMLVNLPILIKERGFSAALSFPHLIFWVPLVVILLTRPPFLEGATGAYASVLSVLLIVNIISLGFDVREAVKWLRGARDIA